MQCHKLESVNKLLLIDYLQLRIAVLHFVVVRGPNMKWGAQSSDVVETVTFETET